MRALAWEELPGLFPQFPDWRRWLPLLKRHQWLLEDAQPRVRVTSSSPEASVRRHFAESLEVFRIIRAARAPASGRLIDVGSGGGFPGLIVAVVSLETPVTLVEPLKKRARLLGEIVESMGLGNVSVIGERAEEVGRRAGRLRASTVTARAVAKMPVLLEYCAPLVSQGGMVALPRGSSVSTDIASGANAAAELGLELEAQVGMRPEISEHGTVVLYRKVGATPTRYPRRPGVPERRPL